MKERRQSTPQPIAATSRLPSGGKKRSQWTGSAKAAISSGAIPLFTMISHCVAAAAVLAAALVFFALNTVGSRISVGAASCGGVGGRGG